MQDVTKDREKYIGGSDIPAILGISHFKTRFELLQEKACITQRDFDGNEYTEYGNVMEGKIREYINETRGFNFIEDKVINGDIRYHADGHDVEQGVLLEIKTTSMLHDDIMGYKHYLVQLLTGMTEYGAELGYLCVYSRPEDFSEVFDETRLQVFTVLADKYKPLVNEIYYQIDRFREDLARLRENPFLSEEDLMPKEIVNLSQKVAELETRIADYKDLEKEYKDMKLQLKNAMQENGIKQWRTDGGVKVTLVPDGKDETVLEFDKDRFREENPDMYTHYLREKLKKGKAGYVRITLPKEIG